MPREYSNRTFAAFPHAVVILLDQLQSKTELKSDEWNRILGAVSQEQALNRLYFYALTKTGLLYPLHGLPESWVDEAPLEEPWAKDLSSLFEDMRDLYRAEPAKSDPDGCRSVRTIWAGKWRQDGRLTNWQPDWQQFRR